MSSLSAHGGLVHVVLCVRSVTSEGIAVLVTNSPKLITFHAFLEQVDENASCEFGSRLKSKFSQRLLFILENYKVVQRDLYFTIDFKEYENSTDLLSLW